MNQFWPLAIPVMKIQCSCITGFHSQPIWLTRSKFMPSDWTNKEISYIALLIVGYKIHEALHTRSQRAIHGKNHYRRTELTSSSIQSYMTCILQIVKSSCISTKSALCFTGSFWYMCKYSVGYQSIHSDWPDPYHASIRNTFLLKTHTIKLVCLVTRTRNSDWDI